MKFTKPKFLQNPIRRRHMDQHAEEQVNPNYSPAGGTRQHPYHHRISTLLDSFHENSRGHIYKIKKYLDL